VQNVKLTPIQYEESKSVKVSWDAPANTGTGNAGDLKYEVKSCEISTPKCKNYGTITGTSQDMKNFDISRGQIYTYHIKAVGKDGTKGEEALDLIKFQKRGK
jgi:Fibronectin type III domain.